MTPRLQREIHIDEFVKAYDWPGKPGGYYKTHMWTINDEGQRVEVEVRIPQDEYPFDLLSPEWSAKAKAMREKLALAYEEVLAKVGR